MLIRFHRHGLSTHGAACVVRLLAAAMAGAGAGAGEHAATCGSYPLPLCTPSCSFACFVQDDWATKRQPQNWFGEDKELQDPSGYWKKVSKTGGLSQVPKPVLAVVAAEFLWSAFGVELLRRAHDRIGLLFPIFASAAPARPLARPGRLHTCSACCHCHILGNRAAAAGSGREAGSGLASHGAANPPHGAKTGNLTERAREANQLMQRLLNGGRASAKSREVLTLSKEQMNELMRFFKLDHQGVVTADGKTLPAGGSVHKHSNGAVHYTAAAMAATSSPHNRYHCCNRRASPSTEHHR